MTVNRPDYGLRFNAAYTGTGSENKLPLFGDVCHGDADHKGDDSENEVKCSGFVGRIYRLCSNARPKSVHPRQRPFKSWTDRMATFTRIKRLLCPKIWRAKSVQGSRRWAENSGFYPHKCYPGRLAECQRLPRRPCAPP